MDYSREQWVRLFLFESADHRAKPMLCRALRDFLLRLARQKDGMLVRDAPSKEVALETLLRGGGAHPDEWDLCLRYLLAWIDDGYLVWKRRRRRTRVADAPAGQLPVEDPTGRVRVTPSVTSRDDPRYAASRSRYGSRYDLVISKFVQAQASRSAAAVRQKRYRDRKNGRNPNGPTQLPLPRQSVTRYATGDVTGDVSRDVTRKKERSEIERKKERETTVTMARQFVEDPESATEAYGAPQTWSAVREVLTHCDTVWNSTTRAYNSSDPRVVTVVARLAEGFTAADLVAAISGSKNSEWIAARPELQTVKTLLKDGNAVDKYARLVQGAPGLAAPRVQPDDPAYYADATGWSGGAAPAVALAPDDPFARKVGAADG